MKTLTTLSLATVTALFIGCGGGGGSSTPTGQHSSTGESSSAISSSVSSSISSSQSSSVSPTESDAKSLTIESPEDVKGYTIKSNKSTIGNTKTHQTITVSFKCDGSFKYSVTTEAYGHSNIELAQGSYVSVDTDSTPHELHWGGKYTKTDIHDVGNSMNDYLKLNANNKLVSGETCWYSFGSGSGKSCPNNLYIESITKDTVCH